MPSFLFFFYYVCVFYNLCEAKNPIGSFSRTSAFFLDNCRHEQKCWHQVKQNCKKEKFEEAEESRERKSRK